MCIRDSQKPHPPIHQVVDGIRSIEWAAQNGINVIMWIPTVKALKIKFEAYKNARSEAEKRNVAMGEGISLVRDMFVADTMEEAKEKAGEHMVNYMRWVCHWRGLGNHMDPGEELPVGYDVRILEYEKDNRVDVQQKLKLGAYDTRIVTFNPFDCYYEVLTNSADNTTGAEENANSEATQPIKHAGKELPTMNSMFNREGDKKNFSRTTYFYLDVGSLPDGTGIGKDQQQLTKSKDENFKYIDIANQSIMRYNQLYSSQMTITIPGDLSLHIGNSLFVDVPKLSLIHI